MNIEFLRNYVVLADRKSFSKAAEQLYISQPALTKQIRNMEEELGYQLVERTTKKWELTDSGEIFLKYAKSICDMYDRMKDEIESEISKQYRYFRIGYVTNAHHIYVEKALQELCEEYPQIEVSVVHELPKNLIEQIKQKQIDCALMQLPSVANESDLSYTTLMEGGVVARVSEKNPLSQKEMISLKDLENEMLLVSERTCKKCDQFVNQEFERVGVIPKWNVVNSLESVELLTLVTNRISFTSQYNPVISGLVKVPIEELQSGFDIVFVQATDNKNPYVNKVFKSMKK